MHKVLVIGSTGLLGSRLSRKLSEQYDVTCTHHQNSPLQGFNSVNLDLTKFEVLDDFLDKNRFNSVFNCAGLTSVEACEKRPEAAWQLNATLPYHLALLTKQYESKFIHVSTDHFLSESNNPRNERVAMTPINQYGYSKLAGEKFVLQFNKSAVVLRTNFFGLTPNRSHSLLDFLFAKLTNNEKLIGFQDVYFSPLGAKTLVSMMTELAKSDFVGLINAVGHETLSKYDFALLVAKLLGKNKSLVSPGLISTLKNAAPRPNYLALDGSLLTEFLKITVPSIESMLQIELRDAI